MTTEEKAKRYDEVVNEIKNLCDILLKEGVINENGVICNNLNRIFPELKETDEERIKKMLIKFFGTGAEKNCSTNGIPDKDILAWLEKQGEQDNNEDEAILHRFSFYSYKDEPNILYLAGLYVNDKYRNKGIGTKILEVADEVAKSLNCHAIRLKTKKDSDAERLYQTHGYNSLAIEGRDKIWLEKQGESVEINPTEFDARLQGTYQTPDEIIEECYQDNADHIIDIVTEQEKPSEWSEEEERIRRVFRGWIYTRPASFFDGISKEKMLAWIEKQDGKMTILTKNGVSEKPLKGNGDFLSEEVRQIMSYVDVVVTNPPFSNGMFSSFLQELKELGKKFIVIGPTMSAYNGKVFNMFKNGEVTMGHNYDMKFSDQKDGGKLRRKQTSWFTNLDTPEKGDFPQNNADISKYEKYDNVNAININSKNDIPSNYNGIMGVPPSVINMIDMNIYDILDTRNNLTINGHKVPKRFLIRRKKNKDTFAESISRRVFENLRKYLYKIYN